MGGVRFDLSSTLYSHIQLVNITKLLKSTLVSTLRGNAFAPLDAQ